MQRDKPESPTGYAADDVSPWGDRRCDIRGCTEPCFVCIDGVAHCWTHFEIMWERWQVPRDSRVREVWDDIVYRHSPQALLLLEAETRRRYNA